MSITCLSEFAPDESTSPVFKRLVEGADRTTDVIATFRQYITDDFARTISSKDNSGFQIQCPYDPDCLVLVNCVDNRPVSCKCHSNKCNHRTVASFLAGWGIPKHAFPQSFNDLLASLRLAPMPNGSIHCSGADANTIAEHQGHVIELPNACEAELRINKSAIAVYATPIEGTSTPPGFRLYRKRWIRSLPIATEHNQDNEGGLIEEVKNLRLVKDKHNVFFFHDVDGRYRRIEELPSYLRERVAVTHPDDMQEETKIKNAAKHAIALHGKSADVVDLVSRTGKDSEGNVWFQLEGGRFAKIPAGATTYTLESNCPLSFIDTPGALPFSMPVAGGTRGDVEKLFSTCMSNNNKVALIAWLLSTFNPDGPYPGVFIQDSKGLGKSLLIKNLYRVADPRSDSNSIPSELPRKTDDIMLIGQGQHCLVFDNVRVISKAQSDGLCIYCTGGGAKKRKLFTDGDVFTIEAIGPSLLGGITQAVTEPDLLDRMFVVQLEALKKRRPEKLLKASLTDDLFGRIFDYFLKALAAGLAGQLEPENPHRLIDFHMLILNALPVLGIAEEDFNAVLESQRTFAIESATQQSPLLKFLDKHNKYEGTKSNLTSILGTNAMDEIASNIETLEALGYAIDLNARDQKSRSRIITITRESKQ